MYQSQILPPGSWIWENLKNHKSFEKKKCYKLNSKSKYYFLGYFLSNLDIVFPELETPKPRVS